MTRYAFVIAALPVFAALAAPASAQSLCDRPVGELTAAQLEACRADRVVLIRRPAVEDHRDTGITIFRGD
jgi:hypothetical protein